MVTQKLRLYYVVRGEESHMVAAATKQAAAKLLRCVPRHCQRFSDPLCADVGGAGAAMAYGNPGTIFRRPFRDDTWARVTPKED